MFNPENELEESLVKAADDPAYRPKFYKELSMATLFVIQYDQVPEQDYEGTLEAGMELRVQNIEIEGEPHIPVFSSLTRLQSAISDEVGYIALNTLEFLNIVKGSDIVLNPGSEYGKLFTAKEIQQIMEGTLGSPSSTFVAEKDTTVLIGQPKNYPDALVDALRKLYKTEKDVVSAYLVHFFNPETDDPPHTLIGLQVAGAWDNLLSASMIVCEGIDIPDPPVDFIRVDLGDLGHFSGVIPFYKKKKFWLF